MTKKDVCEMIDRRIKESLVGGYSISSIKNDLTIRVTNLRKVLDLEGIDFNRLTDTSLEILDEFSVANIKSSRARYTVFYIKHSLNRMSDLDWIEKNKSKFPFHSKSQVFGMLKLKEKLTPDFTFPF